MLGPMRTPHLRVVVSAPPLALAVLAALVYLNTLPAQFAFDDAFAVVNNADVVDPGTPLLGVFRHDFWGQAIASPMSHKSYRPLTSLSFRAQRAVGQAWQGVRRAAGAATAEAAADGLSPLPFHLANVLAHALVTFLVYRLALRLVASREGRFASSAAVDSDPGTSTCRPHAALEAGVAAALFALHPVHTEAVAGVVGHAELLCAMLSIPGLLVYMAAADGRAAGSALRHWALVAGALLLGWAAALAKEIGITIMGSMLCYDALVAPVLPPQQQQPAASKPSAAATATEPPSSDAAPGKQAGDKRHHVTSSSKGASSVWQRRQRRALLRKLLRMCAAAAAVLLYVGVRAALAGDQLVRIYRRVENPIPFAQDPLVRKLTTGYLHARYAWLLLAPMELSADWSYACIDYVSSLADPRNAATMALYMCMAAVLLAAKPVTLLCEWLTVLRGTDTGSSSSSSSSNISSNADKPEGGAAGSVPHALHRARWRAAVLLGLVVGPFFPASNVLFYVGTFIGERLLYFPSLGFCLLAAEPLAAWLAPMADWWACRRAGSDSSPAPSQHQRRPSHAVLARAVAAGVVLCLLLSAYTVKTVARNHDWRDEEALFRAAEHVCGRSAKVQLNMGILERRHGRWAAAEAHFHSAQALDPAYCEPTFHIGVTLVNAGRDLGTALAYLEKSIACKYVAADAVKSINQVLLALSGQGNPEQAAWVGERWARILARPELQRYAESTSYFEQTALALARAGQGAKASELLALGLTTLRSARPSRRGKTPDHPIRSPASRKGLDALAACVQARQPVLAAVAAHAGQPLNCTGVRAAAYAYLLTAAEACRGRPKGAGEEDAEVVAQGTTSFHMLLVNELQRADPSDPWMQLEWGRTMREWGRLREAAVHLEVGAHLLRADVEALLAGRLPAARSLAAAGARVVDVSEAAEALLDALAAVEALAVHQVQQQAAGGEHLPAGQRADCLVRLHICDTHRLLSGWQAGSTEQRRAREHALAGCWAQLRHRGCTGTGGTAERHARQGGGPAVRLREEL